VQCLGEEVMLVTWYFSEPKSVECLGEEVMIVSWYFSELAPIELYLLALSVPVSYTCDN